MRSSGFCPVIAEKIRRSTSPPLSPFFFNDTATTEIHTLSLHDALPISRELGIRMALGAEPERLRRDVLVHALRVSGVGALIGLVAAFGTSRLLSSILFEVSPADPVALAAACGVLLVVVLLAAYAPARRATKIDPANALRAD